MNATTMIPILQHFNSVHQQGGMFYSDNTNQGPVEEVSRHGTATSGSGSDGAQDIIPGGDFDEPDLQQGNRKKNATSWREFVDPSDIMTLPQTPLQRSAFDAQGLQDSIGKGPYRNVSFSTPNRYSRAGGSDTAMVSIGERTKRMSMLSTPSTCLSTSSPSSTSMMRPSAFRLAGLPMTPDPSSSFSAGDQVANDETQPRPIHFTSLQPVMQFTPGPPMHMHIEHPGSAFPFADSFGGQSNAQFIRQASRVPLHQAFMGLPLSTSTRSDLTASTCGFPSTPADPIRANLENSNSFPCPVKTESGDAMTVFQNDTSQQQQQHEQQHSSGKQQTDLTGSPGRGGNSFDTRRYYHPYRLTQTEPISRIATMPATSNYLPATPSVFTFTHPLPAMAHANSSPTPAQGGSVLEGTAQPTNMKSRHHHSGSLQSPIKSSTAVLGGNGSTDLAPYMHSMRFPNQGKTGRHPVSPGGESLKSDVESEIDDDWAGTTAGSRAPLPLQIFGSQGQDSSNSPRLPKKHICRLCGKAFNRPSSLNTHMHTGAKPYQCPKRDCGRKFSVSSNLRRHMKTHEIKEQSRVAQLTARELAAQSHFEVNPQVKLEPEDYLANDSILEEGEEEKELENGSIVYDHNGRAYRYYASESAYQAATGGPPEAPMNEPPFQWACHPEHQQTSSSGSSSNTEVFNRNPPLTSLPFQSGLGNAAPAALSSTMPTDHENGQRAPFEQWMPERN